MPLAAQFTLLPAYVCLGIILALTVAAAWFGVWLVRRLLPHGVDKRQTEVDAALFSNVAILFTVLLAFMVVGVWEQFNKAMEGAEDEPSCLLSVVQMSKAFPENSPRVQVLRESIKAYCASVADKEFPAMGKFGRSPETEEAMERVWTATSRMDPQTYQESSAHQVMLESLMACQKDRISRLMIADRGLPDVLWSVIICFTIVTIAFSAFLSSEESSYRWFTVGAFALSTGLVLFAIVELNYPFIGNVTVNGDGFRHVLTLLARSPTT